MAKQLKITWIKSKIGTPEKHRGTIRALGLRKLHQTVCKDDSPVVRGMIHSVRYMVEVEEVN